MSQMSDGWHDQSDRAADKAETGLQMDASAAYAASFRNS